jgi:hypothetical protein
MVLDLDVLLFVYDNNSTLEEFDQIYYEHLLMKMNPVFIIYRIVIHPSIGYVSRNVTQ